MHACREGAKSQSRMAQGALLLVQAAGSARRHPEIRPETDAGTVVWAKTPRYPWWPAQVLSHRHPLLARGPVCAGGVQKHRAEAA